MMTRNSKFIVRCQRPHSVSGGLPHKARTPGPFFPPANAPGNPSASPRNISSSIPRCCKRRLAALEKRQQAGRGGNKHRAAVQGECGGPYSVRRARWCSENPQGGRPPMGRVSSTTIAATARAPLADMVDLLKDRSEVGRSCLKEFPVLRRTLSVAGRDPWRVAVRMPRRESGSKYPRISIKKLLGGRGAGRTVRVAPSRWRRTSALDMARIERDMASPEAKGDDRGEPQAGRGARQSMVRPSYVVGNEVVVGGGSGFEGFEGRKVSAARR